MVEPDYVERRSREETVDEFSACAANASGDRRLAPRTGRLETHCLDTQPARASQRNRRLRFPRRGDGTVTPERSAGVPETMLRAPTRRSASAAESRHRREPRPPRRAQQGDLPTRVAARSRRVGVVFCRIVDGHVRRHRPEPAEAACFAAPDRELPRYMVEPVSQVVPPDAPRSRSTRFALRRTVARLCYRRCSSPPSPNRDPRSDRLPPGDRTYLICCRCRRTAPTE